jgi:hypothetical protein
MPTVKVELRLHGVTRAETTVRSFALAMYWLARMITDPSCSGRIRFGTIEVDGTFHPYTDTAEILVPHMSIAGRAA